MDGTWFRRARFTSRSTRHVLIARPSVSRRLREGSIGPSFFRLYRLEVNMLVHHKEALGYVQFGPARVYGRGYAQGSMPPTDIPLEVYKKYVDILEPAHYTDKWLSSKFNKPFPPTRFLIKELRHMDDDTLVGIARLCGVNYMHGRGKPKLTLGEKIRIENSIAAQLNSET